MRCLVCGCSMEHVGGGYDRRDLACTGDNMCLTVRVGTTDTQYVFSQGGQRRLTVFATHLSGHVEPVARMREAVAQRVIEARAMLGITGNPFDPNYQPPRRSAQSRNTQSNRRNGRSPFLGLTASHYSVGIDEAVPMPVEERGVMRTSNDREEE